MRRIFSLVSFFAIITILIMACSKDTDKLLLKKDGKWNMNSKSTYVYGSTTDVETYSGTITFDEDTYTLEADGKVNTRGWFLKENAITIYIDIFAIQFEIIESTKNKQYWKYYYEGVDNGIPFSTTIEWNLTK